MKVTCGPALAAGAGRGRARLLRPASPERPVQVGTWQWHGARARVTLERVWALCSHSEPTVVGWLLAGWLGWSAGRLVGRSVGRLAGLAAGWSVGQLAGWLVGRSVVRTAIEDRLRDCRDALSSRRASRATSAADQSAPHRCTSVLLVSQRAGWGAPPPPGCAR
jgi:hypothetical protein